MSNWSKKSRHERGYGAAWDALRITILERDSYLCQCDKCNGARLPAQEVNHIVSKAAAQRMGWTQQQVDHPSNLQAINKDCHRRVSLEQKGIKPRPRIGVDGYPIEE
jgi:5-methylcytosine-specific restriction protein A